MINIQVRAAEGLYAEELKQRKEVEQELAKEKEKLESIKAQLNEQMEELRIAQDQKASLERDLLESDLTAKELEQKILSAVELLQSYKREREELQIQRDNALREAEELRKINPQANTFRSSLLSSLFGRSRKQLKTLIPS